jgi:hypothetical protein
MVEQQNKELRINQTAARTASYKSKDKSLIAMAKSGCMM